MYIPELIQQKPIYSTLEIRWFFTTPVKELSNFVRVLSFEKNKPEIRTDTYFPIAERPDLGLKIRNDIYEVKQRQKEETPNQTPHPLPGKFEVWSKWTLDKLPTPANEITGLAIIKKRRLVKLDLEFKEVYDLTSSQQGLQIEYTEIQIEAAIFYTFALEISGLPTTDKILEISRNIPIHPRMTGENCRSYPAFILDIVGKK